MGTFSGWLRSIWSRKGLTVQELRLGSRCAPRSPLGYGSSNADVVFERHPESLTQQYLTMLEIHLGMVCQLKIDLGDWMALIELAPELKNLHQSEYARSVSRLREAARHHVAIADTLSMWSHVLSEAKKANLEKSPPKTSSVESCEARSGDQPVLSNLQNSDGYEGTKTLPPGQSTCLPDARKNGRQDNG
jgi:hypothetical protein